MKKSRPVPTRKETLIPIFPAIVLAITLLIALRQAGAASFNDKCGTLAACVKSVSELTGQKYIYDKKDLEMKSAASPNLELKKENAEELLTFALSSESYTRVPLTEANTYAITRMRDARDGPLPVFRGNSQQTPSLPDTYDLVQLNYQITHEEVLEHAARHLRSFMPANARIIPEDISRSIIITDTAKNLKRLIPLLRELDQKPSASVKARWKEREEEGRRLQERNKRKEGPPKNES